MKNQNEIPKYRKKKSKNTPRKADHKHDYVFYRVENAIPVYSCNNGVKEKHYWVTILNKCSVCGRKQAEYKSLTESEYAAL